MFRSEETAPGVRRILMARTVFGKDLYPCACYIVSSARLMVDSGSAMFSARTLLEARRSNVSSLLLTHSHEDHTGGASAVTSGLKAACFAHPEAFQVLADPSSLRMFAYRRFMFGLPRVVRALRIPDVFEEGGLRFRFIHAPGHSLDHVVAFEESRGWLFSGDAYIPVRDRVFFHQGCDYAVWVETLKSLSGLGARRMFTGMGVVVPRPSRFLLQKAERLSEVSDRVLSLRRQGAGEEEIAKRLFPGDLAIRMVTRGDYSAVNMVKACLRSPVFAPGEPPGDPSGE